MSPTTTPTEIAFFRLTRLGDGGFQFRLRLLQVFLGHVPDMDLKKRENAAIELYDYEWLKAMIELMADKKVVVASL